MLRSFEDLSSLEPKERDRRIVEGGRRYVFREVEGTDGVKRWIVDEDNSESIETDGRTGGG